MTTVTLTIDGRAVTVERGATVLEAAARLGIDIPTLCRVEGIEPAASCFLCCVQVEGARTLSPSCALPAAAGMVVSTDSEEIRATRKMALELLLSDHAGDCVAPCSANCPAGLDVSGFVREIAAGDVGHAMDVIYRRLSLPGALGRICPRLCEESCRRGEHLSQGLAIAALHRHATDHHHVAGAPEPQGPTPLAESSGKSVAIVGAGPAGLTAAFYLLQRGHDCTVLDAHDRPGGMLRYGIPSYRLPRAALDDEIRTVEALGARLLMNRRWGTEFHLDDLMQEHDAVFLAIGAQLAGGMRCDGEEHALSGVEFLRRVNEGDPPTLGEQVVVIGGGNTAMDAARSALRLGASVRVLYRRTRNEMPCLLEEVDAAEAEGIAVDELVAPAALEPGHNGRALQLTCRRMELGEPDLSGRRRPVPVAGSEFEVGCDTVIAAVGQKVNRALATAEGLEVTDWGIRVDRRTLATSRSGVFAGGDAVLGADLAVRAVAAGRVAAVAINQYLGGEPVTGPQEWTAVTLRPRDDLEVAALFRDIEQTPRVPTPALAMTRRRSSFDEVDLGLDDDTARREALRCMSCSCRKEAGCTLRRLATEYDADPVRFVGERRRFHQDTSHADIVYEPGKCIMCGACVAIAAAAGEDVGLAITGRGFGVTVAAPLGRPLNEALVSSAVACAEACPTGALALRTARACDLSSCGGRLPEPR